MSYIIAIIAASPIARLTQVNLSPCQLSQNSLYEQEAVDDCFCETKNGV